MLGRKQSYIQVALKQGKAETWVHSARKTAEVCISIHWSFQD